MTGKKLYKSYTTVRAPDPQLIVSHFKAEMQARGMPYSDLGEGGSHCKTPLGNLTISLTDEAVRIDLSADRKEPLYNLQAGAVDSLARLSADLAGALKWSGDISEGNPPPNLHQLQVVSVEQINPIYLRVRAAGIDLTGLASGGLHFRLLLPQDPQSEPTYPVVGTNGQTVWPKGDKALHKPVYTIRNLDTSAAQMDFDVFIHQRGRTTQWARAVEPGDNIALMGPGGGGIPTAGNLLMAGDETAVPAITRILESVSADTAGTVFLMVPDAAAKVPVSQPENIRINWLYRDQNPATLLEAIKLISLPASDRFVWFASERQEAQSAREHFKKGLGLDASESYLASFWSARAKE